MLFYAENLQNNIVEENYRVRQKSGPLKFFAVFSATVWDFFAAPCMSNPVCHTIRRYSVGIYLKVKAKLWS